MAPFPFTLVPLFPFFLQWNLYFLTGQIHTRHLDLTTHRLIPGSRALNPPIPQQLHRCCSSTGAYQGSRRSTDAGDLFEVFDGVL
uniref:Secreted protein n=1 Tax=Arundo donax TaxID=35708 RepID=A0A0A9HQ32_ARUDO